MFSEGKVGVFVLGEKLGGMFQVQFGFPRVFRQWVSFSCGQVLVFSRRSWMRHDVLHFFSFFRSNQIQSQ